MDAPRLRKAALLLILPCIFTCALWAQGESVNARLNGTVSDPSNAVVADAIVTLSDAANGFKRQVVQKRWRL